jgi:hypothetical protein
MRVNIDKKMRKKLKQTMKPGHAEKDEQL